MYELKIITQFAAAHQLRGYEGVCEHLHGHNWRVEVFVTGEKLQENGLLVDFKIIKQSTESLLKELDHTFINDLDPFKTENPSSENIARYIYNRLSDAINDDNIKISKITAWESDNACATYMES